MKKGYLILSLLLFGITVKSQDGTSYTYSFSSPLDSVLVRKNLRSYDANGYLILSISCIKDSTTDNWIGFKKYEYEYDANGNKTYYSEYKWDPDVNNWIGETKNKVSYDTNGNETSESHYVWDQETSDWIGIVSHDELEFDHFELYVLNGRMCLFSKESKTNLSFLAKGIYIIRLKDKNGTVLKTMRIVKE